VFKIKGFLLRLFLLAHGCKVGKGLRCHTFPRFRIIPNRNIFIGDRVSIGYNITFEVRENGFLKIGDNVKLTQDVLLSSGLSILINSNTQIGERVSIRDGNHLVKINEIILKQPHIYKPIYIGQDVWIAAGCYILGGSVIPNGVIIGANSTVLEKCNLISNGVYAGNPVSLKKMRG
jgi:acetyltransferase-like isoleucine patch superfamily enzyme